MSFGKAVKKGVVYSLLAGAIACAGDYGNITCMLSPSFLTGEQGRQGTQDGRYKPSEVKDVLCRPCLSYEREKVNGLSPQEASDYFETYVSFLGDSQKRILGQTSWYLLSVEDQYALIGERVAFDIEVGKQHLKEKIKGDLHKVKKVLTDLIDDGAANDSQRP